MAFAGGLGLALELDQVHASSTVAAFAETPGRYLLEVDEASLELLGDHLQDTPWAVIGHFNETDRLSLEGCECSLDELREAWTSTIRW